MGCFSNLFIGCVSNTELTRQAIQRQVGRRWDAAQDESIANNVISVSVLAGARADIRRVGRSPQHVTHRHTEDVLQRLHLQPRRSLFQERWNKSFVKLKDACRLVEFSRMNGLDNARACNPRIS